MDSKIAAKSSLPLLFLIMNLFMACSRDQAIQGFSEEDGFDPKDRGKVSEKVFTDLEIEETFRDTVLATGLSPSLQLGRFKGVEASILLKFKDVPDTLTIMSACIALRTRGFIGEDAKSSFVATMHPVNEDWSQLDVSSANFQNSFEATPIASAAILTRSSNPDSSTETVRFFLNQRGIALVQEWADTTSGNNYGVLIQADPLQSLFVKEFNSINDPNNAPRPTLELEVLRDAELDTLIFGASEDAYLVETFEEPPASRLYVDNVLNRHSVIKFNLSDLPRGSTINRAELILTLDTENSIISETGFFIQLIRLKKEFESAETFSLELPATVVSQDVVPIITRDTPIVKISVRNVLQGWVSEDFENHGLLLRSATPGLDVGRLAFPSSEADSTASVRIDVDFSTSQAIPQN